MKANIFNKKGRHLIALIAMIMAGNLGVLKANPIGIQTAREVGAKFLSVNSKKPLRSIDDLQLVITYICDSGDAAFYVFNMPSGFVIVSADDCATPILGYSDEGQFDVENIPIQLQEYLHGFVEQIQYGIVNQTKADETRKQQWKLVKAIGRMTSKGTNDAVEPLITSIWSQGCYYNELCPEDENGSCGHVLTGCVATAMAQIMRYWNYPEHGTGSYSYTPPGYPEQTVDFESTTYDWLNMPGFLSANSSPEQINAVATLMWHCGVSVNMNYGPNVSTSSLYPEAFVNYFNYSNELELGYRGYYSDAYWKARLKDCLRLNRPIVYSGSSYDTSVSHAFVCDGFDGNDMFHFNWGWGYNNGYYALDATSLLYPIFNFAIFNIHPFSEEPTSYEINVSVENDLGGTVMGGGTYTHGETVTLTAVADEDFLFFCWEENGGIASGEPNYTFYANYNRSLVARFLDSGNISFADPYVKEICISNWDTDGDGELSYFEAALVTSLGDCFFCTEISSFEELEYFIGLTSIDDNSFEMCCLLESIDFPNSVTSIGSNAFAGCSSLTSIEFPNSVTFIGDFAFSGCCSLTSIEIPSSVTSLGNYPFIGCSTGLEQIIVAAGNAYYDSREDCNAIIVTSTNELMIGCKNTVIPNSVTSIGANAFGYCYELTSIEIPNSVTMIGGCAFESCFNLTEIIMLGTIPPTLNEFYVYDEYEFYIFGNTNDCPIYVPYESLNAYKTDTDWNYYESRIFPMAYTSIPSYSLGSDHWRFIASPLAVTTDPTIVENMITETEYDLYQFNPLGEDGEWENYKVDNFNVINGQGYLYANSGEVNIIFIGEFNEDETKEVEIVFDENNPNASWNLVGNPFPCNAYLDREYYVLTAEGTSINSVAVPASTPIPPCTGVMVKANGPNETVVFTRVVP